MKKIFKLKNLIFLIVFLLPSYLIRFHPGSASFNLLEVLIALAFLWWLSKAEKNRILKLFFENKKYLLAVAFIISGLFISAFSGGNWRLGLGVIKGWFVFPLIFILIAVDTLDDEGKIKLIKTYYLSAFFISLLSLGFLFLGNLTYDGRLTGIFNSPNYLAMYIAPAIIIARHLGFKKPFVYFSSAILLLALFFTYSYASWMAAAVSLAIVFGLERKNIKRNMIIFLMIIITALFLLKNTEKFNDLINLSERSSFESRKMIWRTTGKIISDNWLWGIGPGNFQGKYLEYQKYYPPYLEWAVPHPHNIFLTFWLYGGISGIFGFLMLLYFWAIDMFKIEKTHTFFYVSLGIMLYILFHGLVDTTYFKNDLAFIFWLAFLAVIKTPSR
ncbi:MAG TPA: O-antigen ligase family protein [Candidatus Moranbacteria bacterium]|nr:O-antigen ligase family protein [Candidatus Moranbacteria bacterium]